MPVFEHVSFYPHPRTEVFAWHERPGAFVRLTPPGMAAVIDGPTDGIRDGSRVSLRISHPVIAGGSAMLGLPGAPGVRWTLHHLDHAEGVRFADEQLSGPFRAWRHDHLFSDGPDGGTVITDRVTWELPVPAAATAIVHDQLGRFFRFREDQLRGDLALHARLAHPGGGAGSTAQVVGGDASRRKGPAPRPLHVAVAGSSGLIGTQLCALLTTGGHRVTRLVRRDPAAPDEARWDPGATDTGRGGRPGRLDASVLADVDAVVNLAGRSIAGRFTREAKQEIHHSRIRATDTLARALAGLTDGRGRALIQASGIGLYGARRPGEVLTEHSVPGGGFLADVVRHWEAATVPASDAVRVVNLRIGVVLSEAGGALLPQLPLFGLGVGGPLADPEAVISWITLDDVARSFVHALRTASMSGAYNVVAPQPATYRELAMAVGRTLGRPAAIPTPGWLPRAVLGHSGYDQVIRTDQRVSAAALQKSGFRFAHPDLVRALRHVLRR